MGMPNQRRRGGSWLSWRGWTDGYHPVAMRGHVMSIITLALFLLSAVLLSVPAQNHRLTRVDKPLVAQVSIGKTRLIIVGCGIAVFIAIALAPNQLAWIVIVTVIGATLSWVSALHARETAAVKRSQKVAQGCRVLAAQLRIGHGLGQALHIAAQECDVLEPCLASQRVGGSVAQALMTAGDQRGCKGLASLGRAWQLCERSGSPLAPVADRVSVVVAADAQMLADIAAELAVPRLTGRLLCTLPVLGVVMGYLAGGDPLAFLTGTAMGKNLLAGAVVLVCAGLVWIEMIACKVQEEI